MNVVFNKVLKRCFVNQIQLLKILIELLAAMISLTYFQARKRTLELNFNTYIYERGKGLTH